jgi:hypothetical protein
VFGVCLATTRRLKSRPTIKFLIKSLSYCCHSLIAFQPGIFPHFPSFYKTRKEEPNKTDGDRSCTSLGECSDKAEAEKKTPGDGSLSERSNKAEAAKKA